MARLLEPPRPPFVPLEELPDWLLQPPSAAVSADPARQRVLFAEFHRWQRERRAFLEEHQLPYGYRQLAAERRRRAEAYFAEHPEERLHDNRPPTRRGATDLTPPRSQRRINR